MDNIFAAHAAAGTKFTPEEVTPDLRAIAEVWLFAYDGSFDFLVDLKVKAQSYALSAGQLKGVLNCMLADAKKRDVAKLEPGIYTLGDDIYKVQKVRQGDRLYAKRLVVIGGDRLIDATEVVENFDFEYAPGALKSLTGANRMSQDEAQAFGIRYGICCCCGKRLKDAKSVSLGIGPVCRKYFR